jgi:3-phosphoshikimate 1-carboxyvinyltransferase
MPLDRASVADNDAFAMAEAPASIGVAAPQRASLPAMTLRPPGSKSISNRALLLAAMAEGDSVVRGLLDAEDTRLMLDCLARLGVQHDQPGTPGPHTPVPDRLAVAGVGRHFRPGDESLYVGTAGTVARFLSAALAAAGSAVKIDGSPRMRERPMGALLDALREQGATIECHAAPNALPMSLSSHAGLRGGRIELQRPRSSQFVSALLIAAVWANESTTIVLHGGTPARPYVDMTMEIMKAFGASLRWLEDGTVLEVQPGALQAREYVVEPDASAASYWLALAAIYEGDVTIPDLGRDSLQGDAAFHEVLARFGAHSEQEASRTRVVGRGSLRGCKLDLTDMPDMTLTAAVVAAHAEGPTSIDGVAILRHHESDRLAAGATELRKLGCVVNERESGLDITPPRDGLRKGASIDTYLDHRMAMAFALGGDVVINDPACVNKTYPRYFEELAKLGMCDPKVASEVPE